MSGVRLLDRKTNSVRVPLTDPKVTGFHAGMLSLAEVGLGSFLHGLHLPMSGTFLSLNQSLFLARAVKVNAKNRDARTIGFRVSTITAMLKSLSPAGKKLLPMLAISMQGLLFSVGTVLLGPNLVGCLLGAAVASVWSIIQPLVILYTIYGTTLGPDGFLKLLAYYDKLVGHLVPIDMTTIWKILILFAALKCIAAVAIVFLGWRINFDEQMLLDQRLVRWGLRGLSVRRRSSPVGPILGMQGAASSSGVFFAAFRDLLRPIFILPLVLTFIFLWFSEDQMAPVIWLVLRPIAVGYGFFILVRLMPVDRLVATMETKGSRGQAFIAALQYLQNFDQNFDSKATGAAVAGRKLNRPEK